MFVGAGIVFIGLATAVSPLATSYPQSDDEEKPSRGNPGDGLPAQAIARLGSPQRVQYYMGIPYVTFLQDGRTVASNGPVKQLRFFEVRTGKEIRSLDAQMDVLVSPDGKSLASRKVWSKDPLRLLNLATDKEIGPVEAGTGNGWARTICFSWDGRYLAVGGSTPNRRPDDPPLCILDAATGKTIRKFLMRDELGAVTFSPDGKFLATAKTQNLAPMVQVWDVSTGQQRQNLDTENGAQFLALRISPDGTLLAAAANQPRAWDLSTGKERWHIYRLDDVATDAASDVAFSPNGQMVALATAKGKVILLESATGRQRARFGGALPAVWSVAFSPCGLMLASTGLDYAPLIWDVTGLIKGSRTPVQPLAAKELDAHWDDVRHDDAAKAWKAMLALASRPEQAVPLLKDRMASRKATLAPKRLAELLADLDSDAFATREATCRLLKHLGPVVSLDLQKYCAATKSLEAKRRAEDVLGQIAKSGLVSEPMLQGRVLEILEYSASPAAKELLQSQAREAPASPLARDAKAALDRIAKRPAP
jgi:WD40 repeat protein